MHYQGTFSSVAPELRTRTRLQSDVFQTVHLLGIPDMSTDFKVIVLRQFF